MAMRRVCEKLGFSTSYDAEEGVIKAELRWQPDPAR
jgi:hypothetical protein